MWNLERGGQGMSEQERDEYLRFVTDPENEFNCSQCPENRRELFSRLPCGQQHCWVTLHTQGERGMK